MNNTPERLAHAGLIIFGVGGREKNTIKRKRKLIKELTVHEGKNR